MEKRLKEYYRLENAWLRPKNKQMLMCRSTESLLFLFVLAELEGETVGSNEDKLQKGGKYLNAAFSMSWTRDSICIAFSAEPTGAILNFSLTLA